jgi:hypothetical protein
LDSWFYESCRLEVETRLAQEKTQAEKRDARIESIEAELKSCSTSRRRTYKLHESLGQLKKRQGKKRTFGGLDTLRRISYLSNSAVKNQAELQQLKQKYQENRILPICSIGETPQKSNRKVEFDLENQKMIFKPDRNTKFCAEFYCSRKQQFVLNQLQARVGTLAMTVKMDSKYVWLTFDEEKLAGYEFKLNDYRKAIKNITDKAQKKEIYKAFAAEQRTRKLENKQANRYLAVDLNPEYVGISVVDKQKDESLKVIHKKCVDLSGLNTKMGLSSMDEKQIAQNQKRRFEICEVWKYIFDLVQHYKVASFVCEELKFKPQNVNEKSAVANRKTKNLWHRTLSQNLIQKYCNVLGVEKVEVLSAYSSFVGNIQHPHFDPVNASLEIARRGVVKYCKGSSIFPPCISLVWMFQEIQYKVGKQPTNTLSLRD